MQNKSSNSVRVVYPRLSLPAILAALRRRLPDLAAALPLQVVVLFGSWAHGRATAFSDVDLLVIYADPPRANAYRNVREQLALRGLEPHIYTVAEAEALRPTLRRMTLGGIPLISDGVLLQETGLPPRDHATPKSYPPQT